MQTTEHTGSLRTTYPFIVRVMALLSVFILVFMFLLFPRFGGKLVLEEQAQIIIEQIEIPQTQQINRPPPPARPSIPIESESEDISDALEEFDGDYDEEELRRYRIKFLNKY